MRERLVLRRQGQHCRPPPCTKGGGGEGVLHRYRDRTPRDRGVRGVGGRRDRPERRGLLPGGREGGAAGEGPPLVLQTLKTPPPEDLPRRARPLRHHPGEPLVRVLESCRPRRDEPEPGKPPATEHLADQELAGARGLSLPLVAGGPHEPALREGPRTDRLLHLPGGARERVRGAPGDAPGTDGSLGRIPYCVGKEDRDAGRLPPVGTLAVAGAAPEDARGLQGPGHPLER